MNLILIVVVFIALKLAPCFLVKFILALFLLYHIDLNGLKGKLNKRYNKYIKPIVSVPISSVFLYGFIKLYSSVHTPYGKIYKQSGGGYFWNLLDGVFSQTMGPQIKKNPAQQQNHEHTMKDTIEETVFFSMLVFILNFFVISRSQKELQGFYFFKSDKAVYAATIGFLLFGFMNFFNHILFNKWTLTNAVIESLMGGIIFGLTTWLTDLITDFL